MLGWTTISERTSPSPGEGVSVVSSLVFFPCTHPQSTLQKGEEPLQAPGHPQEPSLERWAPPTRIPNSFACLSVIGQPLAWGLNSWDFLLPLLVPPPPSPSQSPILAAAEYSGCWSHSLGTKRSLSVHTQNHLNASRSCCPRGHLSPAARRQRELPGNTRTRTGVGATPAPNR